MRFTDLVAARTKSSSQSCEEARHNPCETRCDYREPPLWPSRSLAATLRRRTALAAIRAPRRRRVRIAGLTMIGKRGLEPAKGLGCRIARRLQAHALLVGTCVIRDGAKYAAHREIIRSSGVLGQVIHQAVQRAFAFEPLARPPAIAFAIRESAYRPKTRRRRSHAQPCRNGNETRLRHTRQRGRRRQRGFDLVRWLRGLGLPRCPRAARLLQRLRRGRLPRRPQIGLRRTIRRQAPAMGYDIACTRLTSVPHVASLPSCHGHSNCRAKTCIAAKSSRCCTKVMCAAAQHRPHFRA